MRSPTPYSMSSRSIELTPSSSSSKNYDLVPTAAMSPDTATLGLKANGKNPFGTIGDRLPMISSTIAAELTIDNVKSRTQKPMEFDGNMAATLGPAYQLFESSGSVTTSVTRSNDKLTCVRIAGEGYKALILNHWLVSMHANKAFDVHANPPKDMLFAFDDHELAQNLQKAVLLVRDTEQSKVPLLALLLTKKEFDDYRQKEVCAARTLTNRQSSSNADSTYMSKYSLAVQVHMLKVDPESRGAPTKAVSIMLEAKAFMMAEALAAKFGAVSDFKKIQDEQTHDKPTLMFKVQLDGVMTAAFMEYVASHGAGNVDHTHAFIAYVLPWEDSLLEPPRMKQYGLNLELENMNDHHNAFRIRHWGIDLAHPMYARRIANHALTDVLPGRFNNAAARNTVSVDRIMRGLDCRTTIMLRHIPSELDIHQLLSILNNHIYGKYDFVYLRIDFRNRCNVGYAFINFADPLDIVDFANAFQGVRWDHASAKTAEISYATNQGRETLVQKFRNSSVMQENADCRPKLFSTEPGHEGEEEDFPLPDNMVKLQRSVQNASTIGLFNRHNRPAFMTRGYRGTYDRGNSMSYFEQGELYGPKNGASRSRF